MHFNSIFAALALATLTGAASVPKPKVLSLPVTKGKAGPTLKKSKRDDTHTLPLENEKIYYQAEVELGTPAVKVTVDIDTGSSDLWVGNAHYKSDSSSTWSDSGHAFNIAYLDGSSAQGEVGTDVVSFAGVTLKEGEFAAVSSNSVSTGVDGIFGIGYSSQDTTDDGYTYHNLPALLKDQGYIEATAFSLWANDFSAGGDGNVLFGGVDHKRFDGTLSKVPIIIGPEAGIFGASYPAEPIRLSVLLNGISLKNKAGTKADVVTEAALPVTIDSGATGCVLPHDWLEALGESLKLTWSAENKAYLTTDVPEGSIIFTLSGVDIEIPLNHFLIPAIAKDGSQFTQDGKPVYEFGVIEVGGSSAPGVDFNSFSSYLLGDPFLSGAYVAYDLDNNEVGFAPSKVGDIDGTDIEAIGSDGIPGTAAPNYSSTEIRSTYSTATASIF